MDTRHHPTATRDKVAPPRETGTKHAAKWALVIAALVIAFVVVVVALSFLMGPDYSNAVG